jgi:hypothetical protein
LKSFGGGYKAPPRTVRGPYFVPTAILLNIAQSNEKKDANDVLGCSTEQADGKAAKRVCAEILRSPI